MKSGMTIGRKLGFSFFGILALVGALSFAAWRAVGNLGNELNEAVNVTAQKMDLSQAMAKRLYELVSATRGAQLDSLNGDPERFRANEQRMAAARTRVTEQIGQVRQLLQTEEGRAALRAVEQGLAEWDPLSREYLEHGRQKDFAKGYALMNERILPVVDRMDRSTALLVKQQRDFLARSAAEARSSITFHRWLILFAIGACVLTGALGLVVVWQSSAKIRRISRRMREASDQVATAASEISSASQSLAQGASEQAASIEETSASGEEISAMTRQNSQNSAAAASTVEQSQAKFGESNLAMEQMVRAMGEIGAASDKISKIMKVIDEIAFQTNILALNAAVEAARAGDAGMGFAVVADEVRGLAQRCAQASRDTASLIEESIAKSREGKLRMDVVSATLQEVTGESLKVKTLVDEVRAGSREQEVGIVEMAKAMTMMGQVTQKTAANAEETAAAGEEMSAQAASLRDLVRELVLMVDRQEASVA